MTFDADIDGVSADLKMRLGEAQESRDAARKRFESAERRERWLRDRMVDVSRRTIDDWARDQLEAALATQPVPDSGENDAAD